MYLHLEVVAKGNFAGTFSQSVRVLRLQSVASWLPSSESNIQQDMSSGINVQPMASTAAAHTSGHKGSSAKKKMKVDDMGSNGPSNVVGVPAVPIATPDLIMVCHFNIWTIGTQTGEDSDEALPEQDGADTLLETNRLECERLFMVDNIKVEDFDSDLENGD